MAANKDAEARAASHEAEQALRRSMTEAADYFRESHPFHEPGSRADLNYRFTGRLNLIARRYRTRLNERLKSIGQTQARWDALFWISTSGDGVTQSELAERMGIEGPTLVRMLNKLEQEGLVERQSTPHDRRAKTIVMKPAAEEALASIAKVIAPFRAEILEEIDSEELRMCLSVFDRVMARLERE